MKSILRRRCREDRGVLTFEWVLLITVLVIGVVGGLSAARDAMITELGDVAEGMVSLDQSYTSLDPWDIQVPGCEVDGASGFAYQDRAAIDQQRPQTPNNQAIIQQCGRYKEEPLPQ